jgi:mono/diheme cytochrome c family protein
MDSRSLHWRLTTLLTLVWSGLGHAGHVKPSPARGQDFLLHRSVSPGLWRTSALDQAWKQWPAPHKPEHYDEAFRERYGLVANPMDNHGLPLGLYEAPWFFTKGVGYNCLLCHAGRIAGQTIIGLGNASVDIQSLFEELTAANGFQLSAPFQLSYVRGTIDPVSSVAYLMQIRDRDLNIQAPIELDLFSNVCSQPPAWWLLKRKITRDWTGGIDARSMRIDMTNLLSPLNSGARIKEQTALFADVHSFLLSIQSPAYPFPVDQAVAARGHKLFLDNCARCHGTYGPDGSYPNKVVPLGVIGTDRMLADAITKRNLDYFNQSWFAQQTDDGGKPMKVVENHGYQAPPLDGIWATAPYFHNGSAPTVFHVLNSAARPKYFTRSYRTEREDYDPIRLGWKIDNLTEGADASLSPNQSRRIYDTTQPGRNNGGHTFGDKLNDAERLAVIEYLKTL